uniref:Transposase n=1 Tax=Heterorhabditis bacteriophora TaxID=37862 RepID=A0A1I7W7N1_HETBA
MRKLKGHVTCDVCTAFKGIQRMTISRRAGNLYQKVRTKRDGELFPLIANTRVTENMFDLFEDTVK